MACCCFSYIKDITVFKYFLEWLLAVLSYVWDPGCYRFSLSVFILSSYFIRFFISVQYSCHSSQDILLTLTVNWSHIVGAEVFLSYSALALVLGKLFASKLQGETFFSILALPEMPVISSSHSVQSPESRVQSPESRQVFYSSSVQTIYILYKCRVGDREDFNFFFLYCSLLPTKSSRNLLYISLGF